MIDTFGPKALRSVATPAAAAETARVIASWTAMPARGGTGSSSYDEFEQSVRLTLSAAVLA